MGLRAVGGAGRKAPGRQDVRSGTAQGGVRRPLDGDGGVSGSRARGPKRGSRTVTSSRMAAATTFLRNFQLAVRRASKQSPGSEPGESSMQGTPRLNGLCPPMGRRHPQATDRPRLQSPFNNSTAC